MNYYKLINGETFVGIATQLDFLEYQAKHNILLACSEEFAQYVQSDGQLYHASWMKPVTTDKVQYEVVELIAIDKDEYNALLEAIETGEEIVVETEQDVIEDVPVIDPSEEVTVEYIRAMKISEMSYTCNTVITNGFDVALSDEETHHFSLTTQDQLNLITLSTMIASGETSIPYHADGELCKFYSVDDITTIITTATAFKTYHVSYFNALKAYITSLNEIADISKITYGVDIPDEYQSDVLKALLAGQDGGEQP